MYYYKTEVLRVVDGDTVDVRMDLGFNVWHKCRVRLLGINAPESRTRDLEEKSRGLAAKSFLVDTLELAEDRLEQISRFSENPKEMIKRFNSLDYSLSKDTVRQDSLGRSELVKLYTDKYGG